MTRKELKNYYYLNLEIADYERQIEGLMDRAVPGAQALNGMPRKPGVSDKVGNLAVEIAQRSAYLEKCKQKREIEKQRIENFIDGIDDAYLRLVFRYRDLDGMSWDGVAAKLGGGNNAGNVKMAYHRYLKNKTT